MRARSLAAMVCLWSCGAWAADWTIEAFVGDAYNFRSTLDIRQDGGYAQSVRADYETRGTRSPVHYLLRAGRWEGEQAWELSLLHHKLYLENPPSGVASLNVSHGFNIVTLNRAFRSGPWTWRLGVGPVVTHAEADIRGVRYEGPYRFSGAGLLAGAGWRFYLGHAAYFAVEGAVTAAYAKPELRGTPAGELTVRNAALHGLVGFGVQF